MLMEMVRCLHQSVSVEHSDVAVVTCMMRLWGATAKENTPLNVLFSLLSERPVIQGGRLGWIVACWEC